MRNTYLTFSLLVMAITLTPSAFAYGDPAAGGFVIQAMLAGGLAAMAVLRGQFGRLTSSLRFWSKSKRND
jgi:hypothetical protein